MAGFSLMEIAVAAQIIGRLASLALPAIRRAVAIAVQPDGALR